MRGILLLIFVAVGFSFFSQVQFHRYDSIAVYHGASQLDLPWFGGINAPQFSKIDLDLDGLEDLFIFDRSDNKVLTFVNEGTPGVANYRYAPEYESKFPELNAWALLRDYNGDGKKDIFSYSGGIKIHKNTSNPVDGVQFDLLVDPLISYQGYGATIDSSKFFNLYVSSVDIPAINDIDGDGDLDVFTFGVLGAFLEYHRNYAIEDHGTLDSLDFKLKNACWGYFSETGASTNKLNFNDTCYYNVHNPQLRHAGSTILAFDNNDDGVSDLLLGDVSFRNIVMAQNGGTAPNTNSSINFQDTAYPSYDTSVDIELFPAPFYEDIDNDGVRDLICAPNTDILTENYTSAHLYKNLGTNTLPNFQFQKRNFIQEDGLELGEKSIVSFFDHNVDGLMDMVVSSYGYFNKNTISYECRLSLYENTGTLSNPEFTRVTDDYQNISGMGLGLALYPTFADIDGDNDVDMLLGDSEGRLHLLTNTAGPSSTAAFTLTLQNIVDDSSSVIDVGQFSAPQLYDYDGDTDYDLVIGEKNGIVNYYENIGSTGSYNFHFVTDSMGKVEIHEPWDLYGSATGYSTPFFFSEAGTTYMISGGQQGEVYLYNGINPSNPSASFVLIDTLIRKREIGFHTTTSLVDIDNNNQIDMFIGNIRGGIAPYYASSGTVHIENIVNHKSTIKIYPNPSTGIVSIETNRYQKDFDKLIVMTNDGKLIEKISITDSKMELDISNFPSGLYIFKFEGNKETRTERLVKF